jgi:hypothetical protein
MPRKSLAAQSIAAPKIDGRPNPPTTLTDNQTELWHKISATEAADLFRTEAAQNLLAQYCRHVETSTLLAVAIDAFKADWLKDEAGLDRLERLLKLRDREVKATTSLATKSG